MSVQGDGVRYYCRKDKSGRRKCGKVDLATGKRSRISVKAYDSAYRKYSKAKVKRPGAYRRAAKKCAHPKRTKARPKKFKTKKGRVCYRKSVSPAARSGMLKALGVKSLKDVAVGTRRTIGKTEYVVVPRGKGKTVVTAKSLEKKKKEPAQPAAPGFFAGLFGPGVAAPPTPAPIASAAKAKKQSAELVTEARKAESAAVSAKKKEAQAMEIARKIGEYTVVRSRITQRLNQQRCGVDKVVLAACSTLSDLKRAKAEYLKTPQQSARGRRPTKDDYDLNTAAGLAEWERVYAQYKSGLNSIDARIKDVEAQCAEATKKEDERQRICAGMRKELAGADRAIAMLEDDFARLV